MIKAITLLLTILLAIASVGGYLYINVKISDGEQFLAEGQYNIDTEGPSLEVGKADLAQGKQLLADGKKEYARAHDNPFLVWADKVFNDGKGFAEGRKKIAAGEVKVAEGQERVDVGEKRLDKGNLAMRQGKEKMKQGLDARDICAFGAILFTVLSIVLGFFWRQSIAKTLKQIRAR
jgi:hypothetical protein